MFRTSLVPILFLTCAAPSAAQVSVLTYHNDNGRTGQNQAETVLTPANVNSSAFGQLYNFAVDGKVDAQPLVVSALNVPGAGPRNVVFAATEHDSLYAFDAVTGTQYWHISLIGAGETTSDDRGCDQVVPEIGITSTPAIDLKAGPHGTIYVVAMTKDGSGGYHHRLHAIDLTTGAEQFGGPVEIHASYPGTGDNSTNGTVVFDPKQYKERTGLLIVNNVVYTSWASHCDHRPYTGWTMGYNELTLAQTSVFNFTPNGSDAAIWGAGGGIAADGAGALYFNLGNGTFDTTLNAGFPSLGDFGNAFVKLTPGASGLTATDYWTMDNTTSESNADQDLGSGGVLLLPNQTDSSGKTRRLGTGAGKDKNVYIFDRDNMGKFDSADNSTLYQELPGALAGGEFASPAWFNGHIYYGAVNDVIRAFAVNNAVAAPTPSSVSSTPFPFPGTSLAISAFGNSNGIVWAVQNSNPAVLHAYDASNLANELYNSSQAPSGRDNFGAGNKFITPTVANGEVFVGTPNSVAVFGLLKPTLRSVTPAAGSGTVNVRLNGSGFSSGATVAVSGGDVTVSNVVVVNTAEITATFTIPQGTRLSSRDVSVTTTGGTSNTRPFVTTNGSRN